ncbi:hypothetical protein GCM10027515_03540 [Schumannella luteola]|uniref:Bifunctional DNA-binding transcriptional regulator/antitoxin component of YhaV-PrlF toxin-antitoxin module n=1 Tax=Schumannella luteola TaxID=472059 RepID=A0A852YAX4_9MICO|nr:hypothetical protein [Schumannella luteola]NYG98510.1 bifunctional DNA-binding transcriptional regulator/antitoxin component of YhaV-PrlF toxin-antitoxin module [Schumannella luteola]TPX01266.1 hypothetical protein FJ656_28145 [Schumannella luteola]
MAEGLALAEGDIFEIDRTAGDRVAVIARGGDDASRVRRLTIEGSSARQREVLIDELIAALIELRDA